MLHLDATHTVVLALIAGAFLLFAVVLFAVSTYQALTAPKPAPDSPAVSASEA